MVTKTPAKRNPLTLAVSGDCHFRDTQYARASRGDDYFQAKLRLVDVVAAKGITTLLDTGDFLNSNRPSAAVIQMAVKLDRHLKKQGIAMLTVTGNHDWSTPTWLDTLFPDTEPGDSGIIPMDDRRITRDGYVFQGVRPYSVSGYRNNAPEILRQCKGADVVIMHATVNGIVECGVDPDRMLDVSELPYAVGVKLIALGDLHYFGFTTHRGVLVGYPGSSEMNSSSEPTDKVLPIVVVSDAEAKVADALPLRIRPFLTATVRNQEDADKLVAAAQAVATEHPVVAVKFSRDVPDIIARIYAVLDPQRAIIRFKPLPSKDDSTIERVAAADIETHGIEYFLHKRFGGETHKDELALSVDLLARGEEDASNILSAYIERRKAELAVREEA